MFELGPMEIVSRVSRNCRMHHDPSRRIWIAREHGSRALMVLGSKTFPTASIIPSSGLLAIVKVRKSGYEWLVSS